MAKTSYKPTISDTLLNALFISPKPIPRFRKIYKYLEHRIFPDKSMFIEFLQAEDTTDRTELTKDIIMRMCMDSNYPPPYRLLLNVIDTEEDDVNKAAGGTYTPQDHFSHLLNLYLLGIYVFFYHPSFNKSLVSYFSNKRNENTRNRHLHSVKDFISSWKYFCLNHDISYPIEILYKYDAEPLDDQYNDYLGIFNHMPEMLYKEYLAESIAKLYVINQLIDDAQNYKISDLFKNLDYSFSNSSRELLTSEGIIDLYSNYLGFDKIYIFDHIKLILNYITIYDLLTVLIDVTTGNPIGFLRIAENNDKDIYVVNRQSSVSRERLENIILNDVYLYNADYRVMYFVKSAEAISDRLSALCGIDKSDIKNVITNIGKAERKMQNNANRVSFYRINDSQSFGKYLFDVYKIVLDEFDAVFASRETNEHYIPLHLTIGAESFNGKRIYESYMKTSFTETVSQTVTKFFGESIPDTIDAITKLNSDDKQEIANELFKTLSSHFSKSKLDAILKVSCEKASNDIVEQLQNEIEQTNSMSRAFVKVSKEFKFKPYIFDFLANTGVDSEKIISYIFSNEVMKDIINNIDAQLKREHNIEFNEIIRYSTKFARYDHGLYSCLYFLLCNTISMNIIQSDVDTKLKLLIWDADGRQYEKKLIEKYKYVIEQTAYSILCHNIYSETFKKTYNTNWIIKLNDSPFTYFCCLMDSLQLWNRPKYMKHSKHNITRDYSISNFDINIKGDQLIISFLSRTKDFAKLKKFRIDSLNDFLENCTDYISLRMSTD